MPENEATARIKINTLLEEAGWRFFDEKNGKVNIQLETNVKISQNDLDAFGHDFESTRNGFIDFLLLDERGFPFIVLEAKSEGKNPLVGKEQARRYAKSQNCRFVMLSNGNLHSKSGTGVPFITISNIKLGTGIDFSKTFFVSQEYYDGLKEYRQPKRGDILYTVTGSFGIPVLINFDKQFCFQRHIGLIRPSSLLLDTYLFYYFQTPDAFVQATQAATGVAQKTVSLKSLRNFIIPLPDLTTQTQIVARIEKEQALVNANKELIVLFEQKIKDTIAGVWGE